ncbi:hypothetical protein M5K25_027206 [Dendrobium thyrsiflorum]|uniref:Uncharacterized protein n=1 Tax=Dendrobium thyrsiflorum TaxID=117978 RepID=A0ABD0TZE8_DENTH
MADEKNLSLNAWVDKDKKHVVFAEADSDFVNVLFSFLTLPLGTIIKLLSNNSGLGCIDNLYDSIKQLNDQHFSTKACKHMLLSPCNAAEKHCEKLKLNLCSGVFVKKNDTKFMIIDDFRVTQSSVSECYDRLKEFGVKDINLLEEWILEFGRKEILFFPKRPRPPGVQGILRRDSAPIAGAIHSLPVPSSRHSQTLLLPRVSPGPKPPLLPLSLSDSSSPGEGRAPSPPSHPIRESQPPFFPLSDGDAPPIPTPQAGPPSLLVCSTSTCPTFIWTAPIHGGLPTVGHQPRATTDPSSFIQPTPPRSSIHDKRHNLHSDEQVPELPLSCLNALLDRAESLSRLPLFFTTSNCIRHSAMASSGPSVTFCFGSDSRVTLPESLLSSLPAGGITFGSFTDSAYVTFGGPTPSEAAAFSPPQRRGRAAMRPFGRPVARQPARAAARPAPVVRAQPVRPVARQPVPRPLPVQPVRSVARRPAPIVPVVRPAPAPQRRQPVVPLAVIPVEATRARVSPPPSSSRKRGAQAELPSPSSHRVSVFARLSHSETARQTPVTSVVAPVPPVQSVGLDVASSSTSGLGRRARRNRNRRLRLAASEAAVQEMVVSVAQQEPVQRRVVPSQREPHRPTVVHTPDVVVAPEIDAVQGGRFSPLVHSGDEEDAGRIAAAPPVATTLPRARVPRDGAARALTQRIRSIIRSARGRGHVSEERLLCEISQVHFQLQRQSVRQSYQWRRGQPPRQSTRPVVTARPLTDTPSVGRRPRRHGRRPPSEPVRSQLGSVVVVPPPQPDVPSTSRRSRWVWRRRQVDQPVETEQTVGTVRRVDTVVPSVAAAVPMICDRAADDVEFVPSVSPSVRVESAGVSDQHGASSPMGPHIDALCQTFSEDDWLGEESEEDVPVHRVCVVTRRGASDEHRDMDDDMEEQGEADVPSTSAQGGPPRSVDTDATVLQLQAQMAEMARAMATMTAQLTALGVAPQVMEVGTPTTSRDEPVVPPVVVPDPVRVERVQRTIPAVPPTVTFSTPVQTQSVQMSPGQIQDMITQKVEQAISSRKVPIVSVGRYHCSPFLQLLFLQGPIIPKTLSLVYNLLKVMFVHLRKETSAMLGTERKGTYA